MLALIVPATTVSASPRQQTVTATQLGSVGIFRVTGYSASSLDPADFAGLRSVYDLQITESPMLTTVPEDALSNLPATMRRIELSESGITSIHENAFDGLTALERLALAHNNLTTLDISDGLTALTYIALTGNSLTALDADIFSTDATLSGLALADADDNAISLTPAFAIAAKSYTAAVANGIDEITVTLAVNESNATVEYLDADDMGIDDADAVEDGQQVSLEVGANTIKVKVTAEDDSITETYTVVATRLPPTVVPADWSLMPDGLVAGDQFRLLFLSSTKLKPDPTDIVDYNTFAQGRAAAGHTDIQTYSPGFRVVGCTADDDARDNTATTYTTDDKGVAIYWLGGAKVAADYEDFYDGDWDDQVNNKHRRMTFHHA